MQRGFDQAHVSVARTRTIASRIGAHKREPSSTIQDLTNVCTVRQRRVGHAELEGPIGRVMKKFLRGGPPNLMEISPPDPSFVSLAKHEPPVELPIFDVHLSHTPIEELERVLSSILDAISDCGSAEIYPYSGELLIRTSEERIVNSEGVKSLRRGTSCIMKLGLAAMNKAKKARFLSISTYSRRTMPSPESAREEALQKTFVFRNSKRSKSNIAASRVHNVIFSPRAFSSIVSHTLAPALRADYVGQQKSFLRGRLGKRIGTDHINVIDNGIEPSFSKTWQADKEGVPSRTTRVIEDGILRNFLYDVYTANANGQESTGNAEGPAGQGISVSNLVFEHDVKDKLDDLVNGSGTVLFVDESIAYGDDRSGDFVSYPSLCYVIRNGIPIQVDGLRIRGNFLDLLANLESASTEKTDCFGCVSPYLQVANSFKISKT